MLKYLTTDEILAAFTGVKPVDKLYHGSNLIYSRIPPPLYDPDLLTYIAGLATELSAGQLILLNTFIVDLKTGLSITNLSDAFDVMYILAGETAESSLRNMVRRAYDATAVNAPTFTALEGFTGNGTSSYIDTNFMPSIHTIVASLNNSTHGAYARIFNNGPVVFQNLYTGNYTHMVISGANMLYRHQNTAASFASVVKELGMHIMSRIIAGEFKVYVNKALKKTTAIVDAGLMARKILFDAGHNNWSIDYFSDMQISLGYFGKGFTQSEVNIITDVFEAYMTANGKGVIA